MFGVPLNELLVLAAAIIAGGVVAGLLAGVFGVGGGVIVVPVLYEIFRLFGVPDAVLMQLCIGTSLAIMIPTNIRSYLAHRATGAVLTNVVRQWTPPLIAGIAIGAAIATVAPSSVFKIAFVVGAAIIAGKLLFSFESWRLGDDLPKHPAARLYGLGVGLMASLTGVSGGSLCTIVLTLYGKPIHQGVATSAGIVVPIALAGTLGYMVAGLPHQDEVPPLSIGFVSLIGFALMAPVSSYTASYGARIAHALPRRTLEVAFGLFMLAASLRFLVSLIG
ncbi:MAG TPA: sulfite exporter TauE/SafE family protein [Burkholderiales bacterium]|nr:sulfite exporter TauE/SafE family protein [Burkholderiales bacterium]